VHRWLNETYPDLARKAGQEGAGLLWCDETGVAADAYPGVGYAREGQRATLEVPKPHIRINMVSAIGSGGSLRFMTCKGAMNGALFLVFLGRLLRGATGKIYLIADRLKAHDTGRVRRWLAETQDGIELVPLPTYSPELNADEYLNNDMKGNVKGAWPAARQGGVAFSHPELHAEAAPTAQPRHELLPPSLCCVCRSSLSCENLVCRSNIKNDAVGPAMPHGVSDIKELNNV